MATVSDVSNRGEWASRCGTLATGRGLATAGAPRQIRATTSDGCRCQQMGVKVSRHSVGGGTSPVSTDLRYAH